MKMKQHNKLINHQEEAENDELWAISYGDMITLLLSFFVIYFSTDFKKNNADQIDNHFITNFKVLDLEKSQNKEIKNELQTEKNQSTAINKIQPQFELLKNAKITKLSDRLVLTFDKMNFFETGVVETNSQGMATLKEFAQKFLPYAGVYKLSIKAFTDKRPVRNDRRYKDNMELSALRALAALRVLQKEGIPLDRLEIAGYGEMNKLSSIINSEKIKQMSQKEIQDISRTIIIIIKHDNEQGLL